MNSDNEGLLGNPSKSRKASMWAKKHWVALAFVFIVCALAIGFLIGYFLRGLNADSDPYTPPAPSSSELGVYNLAAISTDGKPCTDIGSNVMRVGGNAVDMAVAIQFCTGLQNPHSSGLGGGFTMMYYDRRRRTTYTLSARERAPLAANTTMFEHLPERASRHGGLSIAVPGEVAGLWEAHKRFGRLPWRALIYPSIRLCEKGTVVSAHLAKSLRKIRDLLLGQPAMREIYVDPETGDIKKEGDIIVRPAMAKSLRLISRYGADAVYRGPVGRRLVEDIQEAGSIITMEDLNAYRATWMKPVKVSFNNGLEMYAPPPPASGAITAFLLNIADNFNFTAKDLEDDPILTYHRIVEAIKFAYAKRTELGDTEFEDMDELLRNLTSDAQAQYYWNQIDDAQTYPDPEHYGAETFSPEDHGTSDFSLIDPEGNAVAMTSSINLYFGSMIRSNQTGFIFNDQMEDFSSPNKSNFFGLPPSPANFIKPGKRPVSSMSPVIILYPDGDVRLVLGAAGGAKIISVVSQVLLRNIWFEQDIKTAIDARRLHHQLFPMVLNYEAGFLKQYVEGLEKLGHNTSRFDVGGSLVCAVSREADGFLYANSDFRKGGTVFGINTTVNYETDWMDDNATTTEESTVTTEESTITTEESTTTDTDEDATTTETPHPRPIIIPDHYIPRRPHRFPIITPDGHIIPVRRPDDIPIIRPDGRHMPRRPDYVPSIRPDTQDIPRRFDDVPVIRPDSHDIPRRSDDVPVIRPDRHDIPRRPDDVPSIRPDSHDMPRRPDDVPLIRPDSHPIPRRPDDVPVVRPDSRVIPAARPDIPRITPDSQNMPTRRPDISPIGRPDGHDSHIIRPNNHDAPMGIPDDDN